MKKDLMKNYSAANAFPSKLLHTTPVKDNMVRPLHVSLYPTNICNINCEFCSRLNKKSTAKYTLDELKNIVDICKKYGMISLSLSGGGEPMMFKEINELIRYSDVPVSIVTNGLLLNRLEQHDNLVWCRISNGDDRRPDYSVIEEAIKVNPNTDWSFSHVIMARPNYSAIRELISFSNDNKFTHVRLISDLLDWENVPDMSVIRENIQTPTPINDDIVMYKKQTSGCVGTKNCYVSLLRPLITPEGVFPCCGSQYAIEGNSQEVMKVMSRPIEDLEDILKNQKVFDGSVCKNCYYSGYNNILGNMLNKPDHVEFV